jgi:hypothetical protein
MPVWLIVGIFTDIRVVLFGFQYYGSSLHPFPILVTPVMLFFAVTAYGLLWGKDWGVTFGIICGIIGLIMAISAWIYSFSLGNITIRFEPFFQIPFLITLFKVKRKWEQFNQPDSKENQMTSLIVLI